MSTSRFDILLEVYYYLLLLFVAAEDQSRRCYFLLAEHKGCVSVDKQLEHLSSPAKVVASDGGMFMADLAN